MPSYTKEENNPNSTREQYLEKPLPNSADAERAILGAIILDNGLISQAIEQLKPDDFYVPAHRRIFVAMTRLFERGSEINELLIGEELRKEAALESVGGITGVSNLTYGLPHFANLEAFSKVVRDKALARNLVKVCNKIISEVLEEEEEAGVLLDHAEQAIFALADARTRQGFAHIKPVAEKILEQVEEMSGRKVMLTGLTTGFTDFDQMTSGLQSSDLIIVAARPSMGKCLGANSEIVLSDGSVETIEEIYKKSSGKLLTLQNNLTFKFTEPSDYVDDGIKPVYEVKTRLGRKIECTLSHPFLMFEGWKPLYELKVGQKIAVPRVMNVFGNEEMRECEVKLLGYLIGDGCLTHTSPVFTVGKKALQEDFENAVAEFGGVETVAANSKERTFSLRIRKSKETTKKDNPVTVWLKELGLYGCNSHHKFVPSKIFTLKKSLVALFINRLFSTDGWATLLTSGQAQLGFATVSEKLAKQVQHLLLRFGIIAQLKERNVKYKDSRRIALQIDITDARSIKTFIKEIGIYGKEEALNAIENALAKRNYQTNRDLIPIQIWSHIEHLKGKESWTSLAKRAGLKGYTNIHVGKRSPSRDRLLALSLALNSKALRAIAESEVYWDEIVSIKYIGDKQVYDLTIPETHNFVANDICVHNTSLCLTLAQNAAIQAQAVVAVFSLEMSKESLVMRMLCSEGRVDAHRFRSGFLARDEWPRLANALATLSEAKIFIDDTPGISVLEMRAKARRLAAEQKKLDLIVVDYLQLMSGSRRTESRQQEVSQISRELKALAKEMNVPVIALSQLSRASETRTDHRPVLSDLRESGCLTGDSLVILADSGARMQIKNLVGKSGFRVWALNEQTWKIEKAKVSRAFATGRKNVFRLTTQLGRTIRATANHKFYTFNGWKRLDEIKTGERVAVPRAIKSPTVQTMCNSELALLGHLIGDGCTLPNHVNQYTTKEKELAELVTCLATEFFGEEVKPRINAERNWYQVYLTSTRHHTHNVRSAVTEWLDRLEVYGLRSYEKRIPEKVFEQPIEAIALFLRHLWATDGCISVNAMNKSRRPNIYYATSSERLARDVCTLLLRVGINAILRTVSQRGKGRDQYHIYIYGKKDIVQFIKVISAVGSRRLEALEKIKDLIADKVTNTNRDILPKEIWRRYVTPSMSKIGMTAREMFKGINTAYSGTGIYKQNVSRERALRIADVVCSKELKSLADSDVYWDEVVSIEPDGIEDVFDLTVEKHHNFVANDMLPHNSLEQDADVVAFIYREEQYNRTEENAGLAEIILAKQRNGPTGTVKLAFLKEFTRFENMWRE